MAGVVTSVFIFFYSLILFVNIKLFSFCTTRHMELHRPGIEPMPSRAEVLSLNHCTTREVQHCIFEVQLCNTCSCMVWFMQVSNLPGLFKTGIQCLKKKLESVLWWLLDHMSMRRVLRKCPTCWNKRAIHNVAAGKGDHRHLDVNNLMCVFKKNPSYYSPATSVVNNARWLIKGESIMLTVIILSF